MNCRCREENPSDKNRWRAVVEITQADLASNRDAASGSSQRRSKGVPVFPHRLSRKENDRSGGGARVDQTSNTTRGGHKLHEAIVLFLDRNERPVLERFQNSSEQLQRIPRRFGMQQIVHKPAILRARVSDSSSGTPVTLPASISARRRLVSALHAAATEVSSPPCRVTKMRSTSSATTSLGISRVS